MRYGVPKVIQDRNAKHASQRRLVAASTRSGCEIRRAAPEYVDGMLEGIVNFEIA